MPEYLTPGVYIEEIDIGPKPIEGVSTSTAGMVGPTERGPITPTLITSFEDYARIFGGFSSNSYLTYAVDGFFRNGGKRCYIARVHGIDNNLPTFTSAFDQVTTGEGQLRIEAVGPGEWGNNIVYKIDNSTLHNKEGDPLSSKFFKLTVMYFKKAPEDLSQIEDENSRIKPDLEEIYDNLSVDPSSSSYYKNMVDGVSALIKVSDNFLEIDVSTLTRPETIPLKRFDNQGVGNNSQLDKNDDYNGLQLPTQNDNKVIKTGLLGLEDIDDISLVCVPDADETLSSSLVRRCSNLKDRFAIINTQIGQAGAIDTYEPDIDNKYGAIYFPWVYVYDPLTKNKKLVPPCGHIAGIYARVDTERGVHKAPGNEAVRGILSLQTNIDKNKQGILNPKNINVIRHFPGRGNLVWGVRCLSKDPMWKYINVRRLFIFIEKSVERSTQWAVFEPNNERLWSRITTSLKQFLTSVWKTGALMGTTPEEAFFVKCDRTTMTQNDIDNGKLIVIVGIAPTKPAEFVIFRFAQTQAGAELEEI